MLVQCIQILWSLSLSRTKSLALDRGYFSNKEGMYYSDCPQSDTFTAGHWFKSRIQALFVIRFFISLVLNLGCIMETLCKIITGTPSTVIKPESPEQSLDTEKTRLKDSLFWFSSVG